MSDYEPTKEDIEESDKFFREFEELNPISDAEIDKMYEEHCREQNMSLLDTIKENIKPEKIWNDLKETGKQEAISAFNAVNQEVHNAVADVSNAYQAFLVRDSTYGMHGSHEIAMQAERDTMEQETPQPTQDIEPER